MVIKGPSRLTPVDWRTLPAERVASLYQTEIERWGSALEWDTANDWEQVEKGRQLGTVAGIVIINETGAIAGWCYYLVHKRALQIGSFIASSDTVAQAMIDAVLHDENRAAVDTVTLFAFADTPNLAATLRSRGLSVDRYWYLGRELQRYEDALIHVLPCLPNCVPSHTPPRCRMKPSTALVTSAAPRSPRLRRGVSGPVRSARRRRQRTQ